MLRRLFEHYRLEATLNPLIDVGAPQSAWWLLDAEDSVLFQTVDRKPPSAEDGVRWELKSVDYEGCLMADEDYPRIRSLGSIMAHILTIMLQNEGQRVASMSEQQAAQHESQIHFQISQMLSTVFKEDVITSIIVNQALELIDADSVVVYTRMNDGVYRLAGTSEKTPYGKQPPTHLRKGLIKYVVETGEALWLNDIEHHPAATVMERRARNVLIIPIRLRDLEYGVVALFNHIESFLSRDVRLLTILANHAAIAYQNTDVIKQLMKQRTQDAALIANADILVAGGESDWQEVAEFTELDWQDLGE